ncbi:unnamed protein product [Hyaloperonospora brassicae]|uniref:Helicase C-terminal domain-containing protein n=1 Tax=Hyaloperonospora brassicae TaxID=162125 RepID=A0AAV0TKG5_HYABA|nr:unnamed protein product [Hyaloperonospora brassicae]
MSAAAEDTTIVQSRGDAQRSGEQEHEQWRSGRRAGDKEDEEREDEVDEEEGDGEEETEEESAGAGSGRIDAYFQQRSSPRTRSSSLHATKEPQAKPSKRKATQSERSKRWNRRRKIAQVMDEADLDSSTRRAREAEAKRAKRIDAILGSFSALSEDQLAVASDQQTNKKKKKKKKKGEGEEGDDDEEEEEEEEEEMALCLNQVTSEGAVPTGAEGTEDAPVFVYTDLVKKLKPHQIIGARFLWSHVAVEPEGFGCVLADFMGLGKTLQVITTVQAFLSKKMLDVDGRLQQRHKNVLILAPTICVRNWEAEIVKWLGKNETRRLGLFTLESGREKKMCDRVSVVKKWHKRGGILIMGYELYRLLVLQSSGDEKIAAGNQKHAHMIKQVYACLGNPGPDLIVLDEGHRVRNHKSKMVKALAHVKTTRRIILTGYPLQNHLEEYWTMVNFARPDYLGSLEEFKNRYVAPITNGQCIDSSEADLRLARHRAFVLTRELKPFVLRRDQQYLFKQLPPKKEFVLMCKLTDAQAQLYREFLKQGVPTRGDTEQVDVLGGYHIALAISNHPDVICDTYRRLEKEEREGANKKSKKYGGVSEIFGVEDGGNDFDPYIGGPLCNGRSSTTRRATSVAPPGSCVADNVDGNVDDAAVLDLMDAPSSAALKRKHASGAGWHRLKFAQKFVEEHVPNQLETSGKMMILMELLQACQAVGDRVIIFSQSIPTLDVIGATISKHNKCRYRHANRLTFLRIDGSTSQQDRFRQIAQFNDPEEDIDVIMISTKAGGEGINLCAGNRIIIFDVCWNPCNDSQSMCRSYRFGQTKPVFVYRFVTMGTMEKKVYDLQIRKEGVAKRIVDEKTTERKFMSSELQKYFNIKEFEDSLLHAQGKVVDDREVAMKPIPHEDTVLVDVLAKMGGIATFGATTALDDEESIATGVSDDKRCIIDWFEQETMFEEDLDQQCTPAEQKEIMESYTYFKAVKKLRSIGAHLINREGVLVKNCDYCRALNEIYPTSTTTVPIPLKIECIYCKRSMETAGAVPPSQNMASVYPCMGHFSRVSGLIPGTTLATTAPLSIPITMTHPFVPAAGASVARVLPPHMQAMFERQKRDDKAAEERRNQLIAEQNAEQRRLLFGREQAEMAVAIRRQERLAMKLKDRHLLILRRGIKGCQDLKRSAEECGATLAIEVNSQLTDIVSAMSREETLRWLKLSKLAGDVELHDDIWLRNEIAKEKGSPLRSGQSCFGSPPQSRPAVAAVTAAVHSRSSVASTPPFTSSTLNNESPQTTADSSSDCIELVESDGEGTSKTSASNGAVASGNAVAAIAPAADVIEIL